MRQHEVRPDDVVADKSGQCWQRGEKPWNWATFSGLVFFEGDWKPEYGPQGELTLLMRGGRPAGRQP